MKFNTVKVLSSASLVVLLATFSASPAYAGCKEFVQKVENEGDAVVDVALQIGGVTSIAALEINSGVCEMVRQEFINRGNLKVKSRLQVGGITAAVYARLGK